MKPVSTVDINSDDGARIQKVVRNGLISLSLAIIILSTAALLTQIQLSDVYQNKVSLIIEQDDLIYKMRRAARERIILMYAMVTEEDPFTNDDSRMLFHGEALNFAQARIALTKHSLTDNERRLLEKQGKQTVVNRVAQERIVDLVIDQEVKLALDLLRDTIIPGQNKVLILLDQLYELINSKKENVYKQADSIANTSFIILVSIVIIVVLGALYITRQTTHRAFNLISQLTNTREMLQNTTNELIQQQDTLDHHAIVSVADSQGRITYVNEKFCETSGYSHDELIGKNHRMLKSGLHEDKLYQDLWNTISQGNIWQGEICNRTKDGNFYWVESTISPFLDDNGIPYQYVSVRTDITHLLEAKIEAEKANQAKNMFLTSMSHELRTPMNAVIGFSNLLEMELKGKQLEFANEISRAGKHLMALINEVLDLSKIDSNQLELSIEEIDVELLIQECLSLVENMAFNNSIKLKNQVQASVGIHVFADRLRLKQAIINFLSNAIKYNKQGGKVIVSIKLAEPGKCRILVEDTGPGLNEEQRNMIFNPFVRLDEHINLIEGSGVGLTITKRIIEMMDGKIDVESEVGQGSVFWIELPTA